jgi:adenylate cyclase
LPEKPSIAVLPFDNLSGDPNQEFFSDGLTEEIITTLSKIPKIFVIARNSTNTYKNSSAKIQKVSEELGVRYVLEGSVRKDGDRTRITAQFIDAIKGHNLWAERYDRDIKDTFAVQEEISKKIQKGVGSHGDISTPELPPALVPRHGFSVPLSGRDRNIRIQPAFRVP